MVLLAKIKNKGRFCKDVSVEIKEILGGASTAWPLFSLVLVDLVDLGDNDAALAHTADDVLSADEMTTFQGFRFPHRRREWLAGRLAVKGAVARLRAEPHRAPADIDIDVDGRGKPFVLKAEGHNKTVHIAISHSGKSALGLACVEPCALDFQEIRSSLARVEAKFVRVEEKRLIQQGHGDTLQVLGLLWAGKEALRKYVPLWPLLGFLEARLDRVVAQGDGVSMSFQPFPGKRELPPTLPGVLATLYEDNALALIFSDSQDRGR